jgi:hypothetical protein
MELAVSVAAGAPTVTVVDTNGTLGTVTAGNSTTFNDYLYNGNTATVSIPDGNTVESGKIIGTIKYTNCPIPTGATPSPSATPIPTNTPSPSPTPTPTPGSVTGGASCLGRNPWTDGYTSSNKKSITFSNQAEQWFYISSSVTRTIYMDDGSGNAISGNVILIQDTTDLEVDPQCTSTYSENTSPATWLAGKATSWAIGDGFGLRAAIGVTGTFRIWIV